MSLLLQLENLSVLWLTICTQTTELADTIKQAVIGSILVVR